MNDELGFGDGREGGQEGREPSCVVEVAVGYEEMPDGLELDAGGL